MKKDSMTTPHDATLLGFAVDEGVRRNNGRVGAADGPTAFREALARIPLMRERPPRDGDDVWCSDGDLESVQLRFAERVAGVIQEQRLPISIGGGHELTWATFQGITQARPALSRVLVINIDAHFDIRTTEQSTSGTSFRQIHEWCAAHGVECAYRVFGISEFSNAEELFARARSMSAQWWVDESLQDSAGMDQACAALAADLSQYDAVHLSLCLDVLPAAVAPGVSAPAALGVPLTNVERLVDQVMASGRVLAVDIAELNTRFDRDGLTARVAARLAARIIRASRGILPER
jgi:formiminoglutamase